jgi:hypothetical protein
LVQHLRFRDAKAEGDKVIFHGNLIFRGNGVHLAIGPMRNSAINDQKKRSLTITLTMSTCRPSQTFVVLLRAAPRVDAIRSLRAALKLLGRRFGLAISIRAESAEAAGLPAYRPGIEFPNPDFCALAPACGALSADGPAIVNMLMCEFLTAVHHNG